MKKTTLAFWFTTLLLLTYSAWAVLPPMLNGQKLPSLAPMLKQVTPAVVNISTRTIVEGYESPLLSEPLFRHFFGLPSRPQRQKKDHSLGSGVVIDAKAGYVVTNHHVIKGATEISVTLFDERTLEAKLIGADPDTDIALLQVPAEKLTALPLADSDQLEVGDFVVAIGNPFGLGQTVTSGIVSALGRSGLGIEGYEDFIQTDASINPGNSGGALVNLRGELIGLNTAILAPGGGNIGIGFAIPANMVQQVIGHLQDYGEVRRGSLGVEGQDLSPELAHAFGLEGQKGAVISRVRRDSAAEEAGLRASDIIIEVNGKAVRDFDDVRNRIGLLRAGDKVKLTVLRDGQRRQLSAVLREQNHKTDGGKLSPWLQGSQLQEVRVRLSYERADGVLITELNPYSPAWNAGFRIGDVILAVDETLTDTLEALEQGLNARQRNQRVKLIRDGRLATLRLR